MSHVPEDNTQTGDSFSGFNAYPHGLAISPGGDFVGFLSRANDLVVGQIDANGQNDVFRYERASGTIELVSAIPGTTTDTSFFESFELSMIDDGERIAFVSVGDDLVAGQVDTNAVNDVFLRDRGTGTTTLVSHTIGAATDASLNWQEGSIPSPSTPLFFQGVDLLFVGSSDGQLYQLDVSGPTPVITSVALGDGGGAGGSPSLDGARNIVYIGTDAGILYAVEIPLP